MRRFPSVIFVLVCTVVMCSHTTEGESKAALARDFGVKLCGREFIRAVIFTCGGSRWKRSAPMESLQSGIRNPFLQGPSIDLPESRDGLTWMQSALAALDRPQRQSTSLGDLLKELGDRSDYESDSEPEADQGDKPQWETSWKQGLVMTRGSDPQISRPRPNRQKRNFSLGLAGMCCNKGCTKNDIGRLC